MSQPRRDWSASLAKLEREPFCRVCGKNSNLEQAHILGREHDKFTLGGLPRPTKTWHVEADRIVILCGPFPEGCHGDHDHHRIDLLPYLTAAEQAQAVRDAGSIESARRRLAPSQYKEVEHV